MPKPKPAHPSPKIRGVTKLTVCKKKLAAPAPSFDPLAEYRFRYRDRLHGDLPHVVKFSGGRSSGMLLFTLLENEILRADRGDVIVFNNTSSEHPETYRFVQDCQQASARYGIPFFWVQYQTYEDARNGEWTRIPSYRLVNDRPYDEQNNPDGFHWRGEVFEELLSWIGYVPNQFSRICTRNMKLETTRLFLRDWLASRGDIPHLGHFGNRPRLTDDALYRRHRANGGAVPKEIFLDKRKFARLRPHIRPKQRYADFSPSWQPFENAALAGKAFGDKAHFGPGGVEYVAFVGLRGDEQTRVERVEARNSGPAALGYEGEHIYMPLAEMYVAKADVNNFWEQQSWDLQLPTESNLSNCVYCFLKGVDNLRSVHQQMSREIATEVPGFGSLTETPCDVSWWARMESQYGRNLEAEERKITGEKGNTLVGFAGASSAWFYEALKKGDEERLDSLSGSMLPCDCTE